MDHYVGLNVSLKTVFICIINEKGKIVKEIELPSTSEGIGGFLKGKKFQVNERAFSKKKPAR